MPARPKPARPGHAPLALAALIAALPVAALPVAATAQTVPATATQSPGAEAMRVATALVDALASPAESKARLDQQIADMEKGAAVRAMLATDPRLRQELARNSPAIEAGLARMGAIQAQAIGPILRDMQESAREEQIRAFATTFTPAEMNAIATFYQTPAGAKFLKEQRTITTDVARRNGEKFRTRMQSAEQAIAPKLDAELRKLFPNIARPK